MVLRAHSVYRYIQFQLRASAVHIWHQEASEMCLYISPQLLFDFVYAETVTSFY